MQTNFYERHDMEREQVVFWALGMVITVLLTLLAWIGNKGATRLDEISKTFTIFAEKFSKHETRIAVIESEILHFVKRK